MSRFESRYTPRQRRAVAIAQLDGGMTAAQATSALQAGELRDPAGAVPAAAGLMPKSTAHDLARKLRLEREGRRGGLAGAEPSAARAELRRRLVKAADRLTAKVERQANRGHVSADELKKAAQATAAVDVLLRAAETPPTGPTRPTGENAAPADRSPLGTLAAELEADERSARRSAANGQASSTSTKH